MVLVVVAYVVITMHECYCMSLQFKPLASSVAKHFTWQQAGVSVRTINMDNIITAVGFDALRFHDIAVQLLLIA